MNTTQLIDIQPIIQFKGTYQPNTKEKLYVCTMKYNELRDKGVKLKNKPETDDEKLLYKLYRKLNNAKRNGLL